MSDPWEDYSQSSTTTVDEGPWSAYPAQPTQELAPPKWEVAGMSELPAGPIQLPNGQILEPGQQTKESQDIAQYGGISEGGPTVWQSIRQSPSGQKLFGSSETTGGTEPGLVPIALSAPFPFLPGPEVAAGKALIGGFTAQYGAQLPEAYRNIKKEVELGDYGTAAHDVLGQVLQAGMVGMGLHGVHESLKGGPNARYKPETAKIYGDVQSRQAPAEGVPVTEGGPGVQLPAQEVAQEAQVPVRPDTADQMAAMEEMRKSKAAGEAPVEQAIPQEHQTILDEERAAIDTPVEVVPDIKEGEPFAGNIATIDRKGGKILIDPRTFSEWMQSIPEGQRRQAVRSMLDEERIHLAVDNGSASDYWSNLTAAEKAIARRRYTGSWSGKTTPGGRTLDLSDTDFGHEALRFRMQQLSKMTPREIAEAVGKEKWTLKGITAVESAIRGVRETLGTKASVTQIAILDRIQKNLDTAKVAAGGSPAALSKEAPPKEVDDEISKVAGMTPAEFVKYATADRDRGIGLTEKAVTLGKSITSPEQLDQLKRLRDESVARGRAAMAKGDFNTAPGELNRGQFFREAYETATKTGGFSEPAAIYKGKKQKAQIGQEEMFPVVTARGVPGEEPAAKPGAEESGALPRIGAKELEQKATEEISKPIKGEDRPSFEQFSAWASRNMEGVRPEQLRDMWQDATWKSLLPATPERLAELRKSLGLESKYGTRSIPSLQEKPKLQLERQVEGLKRESAVIKRAEQLSQESGQRYRNKLVAAIARRLIGESFSERAPLKRESVTIDDVDFGNTKTTSGAYRELSDKEINDPNVFHKLLRDQARGLQTDPVSASRRLLAMVDRKTGEVELVSTHSDAGKQMVTEPTGTGIKGKPSRELSASTLKRYRPISTLLLKDPVQGFNQRFESVSKFMDSIGKEASERSAVGEWITEGATPETDIEGSEGIRGEGGGITGPMASEGRAMMGIGPGELEHAQHTPMTPAEAGSVMDYVYQEVGKIDSPEDMRLALEGLAQTAQEKGLKGIHRLVISAFKKAADVISRENPQLTPDQSYEKALDEFYENITKGSDYEDYIQKSLGRFAKETGEPVAPVGAPEKTTGARELELKRQSFSRFPQRGAGYQQTVKRPPPTISTEPAALFKSRQKAADDLEMARRGVAAMVTRRTTKEDIFRLRDGVEHSGQQYATMAGNSIRLESKNPKVRAAARAVIASGVTEKLKPGEQLLPGQTGWNPDPNKLTGFLASVDAAYHDQLKENKETGKMELARPGINTLLKSADAGDRQVGRQWKEAAEKLRSELEYARDHWNDEELQNTALATRRELGEQLNWEKANGSLIREVENYLPGMYEGEVFNSDYVNFGALKILGRNYRLPKVFPNYYEAIKAGPYIPSSHDVADIAQSRIGRGRAVVANKTWDEYLKHMKDPVSNEPVATAPIPIFQEVEITDPETGKVTSTRVVERYKSPAADRTLVYTAPGAKPLAVLDPFVNSVSAATAQSGVGKYGWSRAALRFSRIAKHGVILAVNTFHPARLIQYGAALGDKSGRFSYNKGFAAINYRLEDMPKAVEQGLISKADADWASEFITLRGKGGKSIQITRKALADEMVAEGANVTRITDAMFKDAVQNIPLIGESWHKVISPIYKWTFDRVTPGLMMDSMVRNFERIHEAKPQYDYRAVMKDVIKDMNEFYGNVGRQGFFKNPTWRDVAQMTVLAPMWQEGLIAKELRTASRVSGLSYAMGRRGVPQLGATGRGMIRGLAAYFVLTQIMNLITRRHLTFQNDEPEHKMDAWVPTGKDSGFWVSPMSVFADITHDIIRLGETKPKAFDAILQMGESRLGPVGKMEQVLRTGKNPQGQQISTTLGVVKSAAGQLVPSPISMGAPVRALAHAAAPNLVSHPQEGAVPRWAASLIGVKGESSRSAGQEVMGLADRFLQKEGLKKETGYEMTPTDEASYSKLRSAIRNGDTKSAASLLADIHKTHTDHQIIDAMKQWAKRPVTGSKQNEKMFLYSLTDKQLDLYSKALGERQELLEAFEDWFVKQQ